MQNAIIIGLIGKKNSGKDTFANLLMNEGVFKGHSARLAFGDMLKRELGQIIRALLLFSVTSAKVANWIEKHKNSYFVRRWMLQFWGTDIRRRFFGKDYWTRKLYPSIRQAIEDPNISLIVITDVRFHSELELLTAVGGIPVRIHRDTPVALDSTTAHVSERELDNVGAYFVIHNTTFHLLRRQAESMYRALWSNVMWRSSRTRR